MARGSPISRPRAGIRGPGLVVSRGMLSVVTRALCLVGGGALLGLLVNGARPNGVRFASFAPPSACTMPPAGGEHGPGPAPVESLEPRDAAGLCGDPSTMIADERPAAEFAQGHVAGAIHLPCTASGQAASAAVDLVAGLVPGAEPTGHD